MISVTFKTGTPAPDMSRDELAAWLLGLTTSNGPISGLAGYAMAGAVGSMANRLADRAGDQVVIVTLPDGTRYEVSATRAGRWYNRTVTYHAVPLAPLNRTPVRPSWLYS